MKRMGRAGWIKGDRNYEVSEGWLVVINKAVCEMESSWLRVLVIDVSV